MVVSRRRWVTSGVLLLGAGVGSGESWGWAQSGPEGSPALEGPVAGTAPRPDAPRVGDAAPETSGTLHEAFQVPGSGTGGVRAPKSPPPPIADWPTADRPDPRAQWVAGYWAWDPAREDFVWVAGAWRVPPRGAIWVGGRWRRDADGWYRVPGFWSRRPDGAVTLGSTVADPSRPEWRTTGPPADHPADTPGPAPGPDYFFIPGHYTPDGDRVTWTPGSWARVQPGWDWVPARWVRRPDGWDFRAGYWTHDPGPAEIRRPTVARPVAPGLPPAIVESEPAGPDRLPPPRAAEETARATNPVPTAPGVSPPVVVVPRGDPYSVSYPLGGPPLGPGSGMPLRVIRPPGSYPYGPAGVVVPAAVPPFVQRLLDRVLP
jgi:hypothetical protein